jgi:cysteinyl-tRNA synthetase
VGHLTSDEDMGEDKMEKAAKRENSDPLTIAQKYIEVFEKDVKDLNVLEPWKKPRATEYIKEMQALVQILMEKGFAYPTDLAVYFDISKAQNYNQLSGQDLSKNIADAGKGEISDPNKRNPADFVLWFFKAGTHKNALQTWESKFSSPLVENGRGFPGWHIECSAMSKKLLGDTIDLHMGGVEHISVHHTNEIAQSEAANGVKFVDYWLHNEHLTVDGGKMSKSQGTAYSLAEIRNKGLDPLILRYFFLQAHYRSKQNFTWEALNASASAFNSLKERILEYQPAKKGKVSQEFKDKFISALEDDFNLPQALAVVWEIIKSDLPAGAKLATILDFDRVLGLGLENIKPAMIPAEISALAQARQKARQEKNWQKSDEFRSLIEQKGYSVEDTKDGFIIKHKN